MNISPLIKKNNLVNNYNSRKSKNLILYPIIKSLYLNQLKQKYQILNLISPKYNKYCKCYPKTIFFKNSNNETFYNKIYRFIKLNGI